VIQFGDVVPHFDSTTNKAAPGRHEIHVLSDELLLSSVNALDEDLLKMRQECGYADKLSSKARRAVYARYKQVIDEARVPDF
jgi:hypothetical protein